MNAGEIEFGSLAPYVGGVLILGGALIGSTLPAHVRAWLERRVLWPGLIIGEIAGAAYWLGLAHNRYLGGGCAVLFVVTVIWLLWRARARDRIASSEKL